MIMKALASGSNGNCIYISGGSTGILIDAGISCKRIVAALRETGVEPESIRAVMITHEHSDHTTGLKVFLKHYRIPLIGTLGTLNAVADGDLKLEIETEQYKPVTPGEAFTIGDLEILPIRTFHDAADPVAYRVRCGEQCVAVMTDTGKVNAEMENLLFNLDGLLLEANHDIRMLELGSYPYPLKRRILSDHGHLSNEAAGVFLDRILGPKTRFVLLGHLSEENNYPELALLTVKNLVKERENGPVIDVASRYEPSALYEV